MTALASVRLGGVSYLNARPLLHGCGVPVTLDHPARLAESLARGELDAALVPTFELLAHPGYRVVDGVSISSRGPVFSVFLAYHGPLSAIREVSLDAASLTSANLLRCLLAEFHDIHPVCAPAASARLLIGNQAIAFRRAHGDACSYLDLGEEWQRRTSLPFVYAMWLIRRDVPHAARIAEALRAMKADGMENLDDIIASGTEWDAAFRSRYLRSHIKYELGADEKRGIERYRELLARHSLIPQQPRTLEFV